jgi:uncharacterized membrane-anchored protein YitT (DUF2179 family)
VFDLSSYIMMKSFLKTIGIVLLLVGVIILIIPFFLYIQTNNSLLTGWLLIVAGFITYIVTNKYIN